MQAEEDEVRSRMCISRCLASGERCQCADGGGQRTQLEGRYGASVCVVERCGALWYYTHHFASRRFRELSFRAVGPKGAGAMEHGGARILCLAGTLHRTRRFEHGSEPGQMRRVVGPDMFLGCSPLAPEAHMKSRNDAGLRRRCRSAEGAL